MSITLLSPSNEKITISRQSILLSSVLSDMVVDDDDPDVQIPLGIETFILQKVVSFCDLYRIQPFKQLTQEPLRTADIRYYVPDQYVKFLDLDVPTIFQILQAANFLDIAPLLDLMCLKIACMMKGQTPENMRKTFGIENDLTLEEQLEFTQAHSWIQPS